MDAAAMFVQPHQKLRMGTMNASKEKNLYVHPKLAAIMSHLSYEYADFKYTVYRCAAKFVTLQKVLYTGSIPFKLVLAILERHHIKNADVNFMVPPFQLTAIVNDIYFASEKLGHFSKATAYNMETATTVLSNFFWNIFDPYRRHSISLLEIKVTFLLLCKLYASDLLISEFYQLLYDPKTKCVSKLKFEYLLNALTKIITYIGEGGAYGAHNIPLIIEHCYSRCPNRDGLTEYQFHCLWTNSHTRFIIYANLIALIKRIEDTNKLIHDNNPCACCRMEKIIGIRFKCQNCSNLSLCLKCFATGFATGKHLPGHRMYEVFTDDPPPKKFSHFLSKLCSMFFHKNIEDMQGFCNSNETGTINETELVTIAETQRSLNAPPSVSVSNKSGIQLASSVLEQPGKIIVPAKEEASVFSLSTNLSAASSQASERMQLIIDRLLQQNMRIENQLNNLQNSTTEEISCFLTKHQQFLIEIINEMRNLSNSARCLSAYPTSSTPNRSIVAQQTVLANLDEGANLSHSVNGADLNRTYLDANKSDYSTADLSLWFNQRRMSLPPTGMRLSALPEIDVATEDVDLRDTEMANFKLLLNKVKEIVEDSYSDNTELSAATQNLENVLDNIIKSEESRRRST